MYSVHVIWAPSSGNHWQCLEQIIIVSLCLLAGMTGLNSRDRAKETKRRMHMVEEV